MNFHQMTHEQKTAFLKKRIKQCGQYISRQRSQNAKGKAVRVRPEFWEQVRREYQQQLKDLS